MKLYFFIAITLVYTTYTHTAEVQGSQKARWLCCFARNTPKKPSARLLRKLGSLNAMEQWGKKKEIIQNAVREGIHPDALRYGTFALYDAIINHDQDFTVFLLNHGADPNQKDESATPIIFHAKNSTILRTLLDHKANACVKDQESRTLLHAYTEDIDPNNILTYCNAGVDPCAVDSSGKTAIHSLLKWLPCFPDFIFEPLELLVYVGTPLDITPSKGPYQHMSLDQIIGPENKKNEPARSDCIEIIIVAAEKRKRAIHASAPLTKDPLGIVIEYDGQTTAKLEKLHMCIAITAMAQLTHDPQESPDW